MDEHPPSFRPPQTVETPAPLSRKIRTPIWLWALAVVLMVCAAWRQRPVAHLTPEQEQLQQAQLVGLEVAPPGVDKLVLFGRLGLGIWGMDPAQGAGFIETIDQQVINERTPAADRLRVAVLAHALGASAEASSRLEELEEDLDPESPLRQDIRTLERLFTNEPIPDEAVQELRQRHTWFADLAFAARTGPNDPFIERQVWDGYILIGLMIALLTGLAVVFLGGFALLITGIVMIASGTTSWGMPRPVLRDPRAAEFPAGSRLWLEAFCVFVAGFLLLGLVGQGLASLAPDAAWTKMAGLSLHLLLVPVPFWPLLRGMPRERFFVDIGLHRGRGIAREVGAGVLGYIASLFVYFLVAILVVLTAAILLEQEEPPVGDNKILEMFEGGNIGLIIMLFLLATLWAPFVEECIFRGCVYRVFRYPWGWGLGAAASACLFAVMHGYVVIGLVMVGTLGVMFALLREWRGSLIPSMTAHFLHNGIVTTVMLVVLRFSTP